MLRIAQWTTGNVAREAVGAILLRSDMELVGAYAHSAEKAGAGTLTVGNTPLSLKEAKPLPASD